jgi:hypothetical protein
MNTLIVFSTNNQSQEIEFRQFDYRYAFYYKDHILYQLLETKNKDVNQRSSSANNNSKIIYARSILKSELIKMKIIQNFDQMTFDQQPITTILENGLIYMYSSSNNRLCKRKLTNVVIKDCSRILESSTISIYNHSNKLLFKDDAYDLCFNNSSQKLSPTTYIFTDQLYRIYDYGSRKIAYQITHFKEDSLPNFIEIICNQHAITKGIQLNANQKFIFDETRIGNIAKITTEDIKLLKECSFEIDVDIC